jgi:chemotaxis family two-component system sensor kinase Cph1
VMFTDGLVERRDRGFDVGVSEVAAALAGLPSQLTSREVTDALLAALLRDGEAEDDVAILVVENVS